LSNERIRMEATMLRETVIAPQAFAYGVVYFLHPSKRKLVFPLHLLVNMGDETFEVAFEETR
ncbi:MAG TPA: hypothetical protein VE201_06290, partial [Nitrospirales bacterium]|nr:hypothetical protein [Nitrospirales bacterium]